jgi:hypothetical protein
MMEMELFSETVDFIIHLTRLSAREGFADFVAVKSSRHAYQQLLWLFYNKSLNILNVTNSIRKSLA